MPRWVRLKKRICQVLVEGKECGLALSVVEREAETATQVCECALGHRTYVPVEPPVIDEPC
jgi:hypothetical protein